MEFVTNINGDSPDALGEYAKDMKRIQEAAVKSLTDLSALAKSIQAAYPHGRNYQTLGANAPDARMADVAVFDTALRKLDEIRKDLIEPYIERLLENAVGDI